MEDYQASDSAVFLAKFKDDFPGYAVVSAADFADGELPPTLAALSQAVRGNATNKFPPTDPRTKELLAALAPLVARGGSALAAPAAAAPAANAHEWSVAVSVVEGSFLAAFLDPGTTSGAPAQRRDEFLAAVQKHIACMQPTQPPKPSAAKRPLFDEPKSEDVVNLIRCLKDCTDPRQLFVHMPPTPKTAGSSTLEAAEEVDYALFCGGRDVMGEWGVAPLGRSVTAVVVARAALGAARATVVLRDAAPNADHDNPARRREHAIDLHAFRCFVDHYLQRPFAPLAVAPVHAALASVSSELNNAQLLDSLRQPLTTLTNPRLVPYRGCLLWGPPGTAKSTVMAMINNGSGFAQVVPAGIPITAGEAKGGLVGQSEGKVKALLRRPLACPWLVWGLMIDEIEVLVPNRNMKSSAESGGTGSSTLGLILAWFGDTSPVRNLFLFAATNYRKRIDEAFARRVSKKIFVGLPTSAMRRQWVALTRSKEVDTSFVLDDAVRETMTHATINFSGANMNLLMCDLQLLAAQKQQPNADSAESAFGATQSQSQPPACVSITKSEMLAAVRIVAQNERVFVGGVTVAELQARLLTGGEVGVDNATWKWFDADFGVLGAVLRRLLHERTATGRVLVDIAALHDRRLPPGGASAVERVPLVDVELQGSHVHMLRPQLRSKAGSGGATIQRHYLATREHFALALVHAAVELDVGCIRFLDNAFFAAKGCDSEAAMVDLLREEVEQAAEYDRAMIVLDLDAAFVDVNFDDERVQEKVHRMDVFGEMLDVARRFPAVSGLPSFRMVVVLSAYDALLSRARHHLVWPENRLQCDRAADDDYDRTEQPCAECRALFKPGSNDMNECRPHSDKLISTREAKDLRPTEEGIRTIERVRHLAGHERQHMIWLCCGQSWSAAQCNLPRNARAHRPTVRRPAERAGAAGLAPRPVRHAVAAASAKAAAAAAPTFKGCVAWCNFCGAEATDAVHGMMAPTPCSTCAVCGCGKPLHATRVIGCFARAASCVSCLRKSDLHEAETRFLTLPEPRPHAQWFTCIRGQFLLFSAPRVRAALELAAQKNGLLGPTGRAESRWEIPWGPFAPNRLFVHAAPLDAASLLSRGFIRGLPANTDVSRLQVMLACLCHPYTPTARCVCTPSTPNTELLLRMADVSVEACTGVGCSDPSLAHRLAFNHRPLFAAEGPHSDG